MFDSQGRKQYYAKKDIYMSKKYNKKQEWHGKHVDHDRTENITILNYSWTVEIINNNQLARKEMLKDTIKSLQIVKHRKDIKKGNQITY